MTSDKEVGRNEYLQATGDVQVINVTALDLSERFRRNSYRILGLPGKAPQAAIHEATGMMRRGFKLGVCKTTAWDLLWLGPLTRAETDVQDAAARLGNPALRLRERLFWFHDGEELVSGISLA